MKAKTLTILAVLLMLALMVMPVLALSAVGTASSDPPNTTRPLVVTNRADVTPTINITPLLLSSQQAMGTIVTQTLIISNTGSGDLVWQIVESAAAQAQSRAHSTPGAREAALPARSNMPAAAEVIRDGGFELGHPNPDWEEYSAYNGRVLYSGSSARTGSWLARFGGAPSSQAENAYISQTVTITPGLATLEFWMRMSASGSGDFTVTLDSTVIFTANQTLTSTYATYTLVTRDVTAFANGQAHVVKLAESDPDTPGLFNVYVDDVSLKVIDCIPSNLPWLTVSPISGTTGISASSNVDFVFNSTGHVGTYTGTLCIISNDPIADVIRVPVTLKSIAVFLPLIRR
ncbi:hypothetical protein TFLX_02980 [Thermoflexales bacterium]|nr:hypothetical protein TFLX_02980 [Thermoflexales bacterium]